jgi:hypothetical protein
MEFTQTPGAGGEEKTTMKLGIISDIHANRVALEAVLADLEHEGVERVVCLGDVAVGGPQPSETVALLRSLPKLTALKSDIEACALDWTLYPNCDYSIQWFSRGCIRNCPFCVVRQKEGYIHPVAPKNLNPNGNHILIMDNNFFASPKWRESIQQLQEWDQPVNFHQGIDMRIIDKEQCDAINSLKQEGRIHFAWDNPKEDMAAKLKEVFDYIRPYRLMCYVLIGYWSTPEQDLERVETLRSLGVDPFVMPFNKHDRYQRDFARWVNHKAIFKSVKWGDYNRSEKKAIV